MISGQKLPSHMKKPSSGQNFMMERYGVRQFELCFSDDVVPFSANVQVPNQLQNERVIGSYQQYRPLWDPKRGTGRIPWITGLTWLMRLNKGSRMINHQGYNIGLKKISITRLRHKYPKKRYWSEITQRNWNVYVTTDRQEANSWQWISQRTKYLNIPATPKYRKSNWNTSNYFRKPAISQNHSRSYLKLARLVNQSQGFAACFSFAFWIFNTFFTIFCSSTKKARMILQNHRKSCCKPNSSNIKQED